MTNAYRKLSLLIAGLLVTAPMLSQDTNNPFKLSVNVDLVQLHVTVVDGKQRPIGGLLKENFRILENKIEQPIAIFKQEDIPLSLGLILDNSRSIEPRKERLDTAALSFIKKSNPEDEAFVVHFDFDARLSQEFSQDANQLRKTLTSAKPYGQTAIYDAVSLALGTMGRARYDKKALLLVTDGIDNHSVTAYPELIEKVKRANVAIYVVGLLSVSGGLAAEDTLIEIAEASGGRAYFPQSSEQASAMMEQIARDLREQYTIGYFPTNPVRDGEWRSVRVEITSPRGLPANFDVTYRRGYYAPSEMAR